MGGKEKTYPGGILVGPSCLLAGANKSQLFKRRPVVPATVAIFTVPSIPSNEPVPNFLFYKEEKKRSRNRTIFVVVVVDGVSTYCRIR